MKDRFKHLVQIDPIAGISTFVERFINEIERKLRHLLDPVS